MSDPNLVDGARHNLAQLEGLHDDLADSGGVVVVAGQRGVGKALLLAELRKNLAQRGRLVLLGRADRGTTQPYALLHEPAAQALAFLEARGLVETFLERHALALSVLVPALQASSMAPRARDKTAFLEGLRALFVDLGRTAPLTLLLTDLHAADDDAREAVLFLANHLFSPDGADGDDAHTGVLVVSSRDEEGSTGDERGLVDALSAGRRSRLLAVEGLNRAGLLSYLSNHPLLERLLTASRGRPEDVDELLEALPHDAESLLRSRVDALPVAARQSLHALAILGRPVGADLIAAVLQTSVADVARTLGAMVEQRLLGRRLHNGELLFSFVRPHHPEVLVRGLSDEEAHRLHHAIGQAFLAREAPDEQLAFHFLRGTEPTLGLPHAVTAAEKLLLTFGYAAAADLLKVAIPVARRAADVDVDGANGAAAELHFQLTALLVEAERLRGQLSEALEHVESLRILATPAQMPAVLRQMGELLSQRGEHREALDVLEEALTRADERRDDERASAVDRAERAGDADALPERALILAAMAEVAYKKSDLEGATAFADRALHAAPAAPMAFRLRVRNTLGKVLYSRERYDDADRAFSENLRFADEHHLGPEAVLARINVGLTRHRLGRQQDAREHLERALAGARAIGDLANEAAALANLGTIAQRLGELPRALDSYRAALARFLRIGNRSEVRRTTWNLANLSVAIGHLDAAETYLEQSRRIAVDDEDARGLAFVYSTEAEIALSRGEPARAIVGYDRALQAFAKLGEQSRVDEMTAKLAWAHLFVGDIAGAESIMQASSSSSSSSSSLGSKSSTTPTMASVRYDAVRAALATYGSSGVVGLARLEAAVDELERQQATDDAWRALATLAERADELGEHKTAQNARARGRAIVEQQADALPVELRPLFLRDATRARLLPPTTTHDDDDTPAPGTDPDLLDDGPGEGTEPNVGADGHSLDVGAPTLPVLGRKPEWDERYPDLVGRSPALHRVLDRLDRVGRTKQTTVLVRGESGTGKELVAAAVHRLSERRQGPFVRVNCAALVETLLMSELFGHEKGSFTGALARKIGRFELARGGTIFLDEIGDISPKTQVSLLRVLQERQFERVGGTQTVTTDAVVVCATHRDLEEMVRQGTFREDLYYRLKGVVVEVPALRERPEDIPLLVQHFLDKARTELGRAPRRVAADAMDILSAYPWPGNIRELQNVIRSVALFCEGDVVDVVDLAEFPELFDTTSVVRKPTVAADRASEPRRAPAAVVSPTRPSVIVEAPPRAVVDADHPVPARRAIATPSLPTPAAQAPAASHASHASGTSELPSTGDVLRRVGAEAEGLALGDLKRRLEFEAIANAIRQTNGNVTRAAAILKMKRPRLSQIINGNPDLRAIKEALRTGDD